MEFGHKLRGRNIPKTAKGSPLKAVITAVFVMFIVSGLLLLILAGILFKMELGESVIRIGVIVIYVIAGLIGGFLMGKIMQEQKFLWGLSAGAIYFVILFVASMVVKGGFDMEMTKVLTTLILCAASGMVGGMIS